MKTLAGKRRHPAALFVLIAISLLVTGSVYAMAANVGKAEAAPALPGETQIEEGKRLFLEGCSSCHGLQAEGIEGNGPSLIGVGAASVHFQVATGRMPLAGPAAQAPANTPIYDDEQIAALAAYVASLAPGPEIPTAEMLDFSDANVATGAELFRANCSQCHQAAGRGGALTEGKWAPDLTHMHTDPQIIYEAMVTGPQNMPIFANTTLSVEDKQEIIAYIDFLQNAPSYGGNSLGRFGPVTEGLFLWIGLMFLLVLVAIWIGSRVR